MKPLAMVTGGAKRVGREICLHLAKQGFDIILHYRHSETEAVSTRQELVDLGANVTVVQADLTVDAEIRRLFADISNKRPLKLLVNTASNMPRTNILEPDYDTFSKTLAINLYAPWLCSSLAAETMIEGGLILNFSDVGTRKLWTAYPEYIFAKNSVEILTRMHAKKLAPRIRVNAIAPGMLMKADDITNEEWERLVAKAPLKHGVPIKDLLASIDFLLRNKYVTGEIIDLSSGYQVSR